MKQHVRLLVPRALEQYAGGKSEFRLEVSTVADALSAIKKMHPQVYECICDETGRLRQHINLFVNEDLLPQREQFSTCLQPGDVLYVFQSVSGG